MPNNDPQVPWTDEQWARVNAVIQEEAARARVAAKFLPLVGPLSPDTDFVRVETVGRVPGAAPPALAVEDRTTRQLACIQVRVQLRGAQMQDPELTSALSLFRRAANMLARLEDGIVLDGLLQAGPGLQVPAHLVGAVPPDIFPPRVAAALLPIVWQITSAAPNDGLYQAAARANQIVPFNPGPAQPGRRLVAAVTQSIGELEERGHFGPYALVLGNELFSIAQAPEGNLVLPQDRIIPFLGGGSLLRSSTLGPDQGIMAALGGSAIELVVATDLCLQFLQVTVEPAFIFRVSEKIILRIKDTGAVNAFRP
jgi:uncharacterized linocin/CFP29 family protein